MERRLKQREGGLPSRRVARIKVRATTETELKDKKLRYKDALNLVQSARELVLVPVGVSCLACIQDELTEEILSEFAVRTNIKRPEWGF